MKENWLNKWPIEFIGMLIIFSYFFESPESADSFRKYMYSKHPNINFSVEQEII